LLNIKKFVDYSFLWGFLFVVVFNISVHFAYGNELNNSVPNLKDIDMAYNKSEHRSLYYASQIINQTKTETVELVGNVTHVVDGDTLDINGIRVRLTLVDTPEKGQPGFKEAKEFVNTNCLGKKGELDVDDGQRRGDRYGREIGIVYCDGLNINEELMGNHLAKILTEYCDVSEFSQESWAKASCNLK
jgi:Staphylococcal nuclease homologue